MTDIGAVLSSSSGAAASNSQSKKDFDSFVGTREDFLTILLAQLKHQDPLNPMEGTEFIDSITRLSSVEQSINQNAHLEKIESLLQGERDIFGTPVSYLDKEIDFESSAIKLEGGEAQFTYNLEERPPGEIFVVIRDVNGTVVRRAEGARDIGKNIINWDGKDNAGNSLSDGEYFVQVDYLKGRGEDEKVVSVPTYTSGVVTGANFEDGEVILLVGNIKTTVGDITAIRSVKQEDTDQVDD